MFPGMRHQPHGHAYNIHPAEGEIKWGKVKTTNSASTCSTYSNNSVELLLEEASSFQLKSKENNLILTGGKSLS